MSRRRALALVGAVAALLAIGAQLTGALGRVEAWTVDARFSLRGAQPARDVAVVSIGDADISAFGRWPMNRRLHARWRSFDARHKRPVVANTAIARELAGWCWALAVMNTEH